MTNLTTACYNIEDGKVVEGTLADFSGFIEQTTRPNGVGYKYYTTTVERTVEVDTGQVDEDGDAITERVETDVWVLAKWATWGGPQVVVREFKSEEEANAAAEDTYVYDILRNSEIEIYLDRADAERALADTQTE